MALIDTGLGWYAEESWLSNTAGEIGKITSEQPEVYGTYPDNAWVAVMYSGGRVYWLGYSTTDPGDPINAVTIWGQAYGDSKRDRFTYISCDHVEGQRLKWVETTDGALPTNRPGDSGVDFDSLNSYTAVSPNLYIYKQKQSRGQTPLIDRYLGVYEVNTGSKPSDEIAADELAAYILSGHEPVSATFNKSTSGYSVICMCKWRAEYGGSIYCSPILISTEPNNTLYTRNSATPTAPTSEHTISDVTFYMRKAPLDIIDETEIVDSDFPIVDLSTAPQTNNTIFAAIASMARITIGDTDPYAHGGESGPASGDGTFDFSSTEIPYSGLPTIGAFATGMINVYVPTRAELVALSQYLWAGAFDVDNFKKLVADPMDVLIGLQIIPLTAAQIGVYSDTLIVGNISTGLSMDRATKQYVEVNMGTVSILPKWGAYLDFSPYSKLTLFLPYIGYVEISPDDCMNGTISVKYYVDIISGNCVAQVKCNDHVLYQFSGNCSCQLPVTAGQYQNIAIAGMNVLGAALGMASSMIMPKGGGDTGDKLGAVSGAANFIGTVANEGISMFKPAVQRSGGFGASSGLMGIQSPYLILTVPRMCIPGDQNKYIGYPSFVTKVMSDLSGFNSVQVTHLNNMSCTAEEADEIIALLSEGVIF